MKRSFESLQKESSEDHEAQQAPQHEPYALHAAVCDGELDMVVRLIAEGADVNQPLLESGDGEVALAGDPRTHWNAAPPIPLQNFTPLMLACRWGYLQIDLSPV